MTAAVASAASAAAVFSLLASQNTKHSAAQCRTLDADALTTQRCISWWSSCFSSDGVFAPGWLVLASMQIVLLGSTLQDFEILIDDDAGPAPPVPAKQPTPAGAAAQQQQVAKPPSAVGGGRVGSSHLQV
jgi:hypothetical protein